MSWPFNLVKTVRTLIRAIVCVVSKHVEPEYPTTMLSFRCLHLVWLFCIANLQIIILKGVENVNLEFLVKCIMF